MEKVRKADISVDEALVGTMGLSASEAGVYWVVMLLIYSTGGCIPRKDSRLYSILRDHPNAITASVHRLIALGKLTLTPGEYLSQPRVLLELDRARARIAKARESGMTGGRPVTQPELNQGVTKPEPCPTEKLLPPTPPPSSSLAGKRKKQNAPASAPLQSSAPSSVKTKKMNELGSVASVRSDTDGIVDDPVKKAVGIFNAVADQNHWPKCQDITVSRRRKIRARLETAGGIEGWRVAMEKAGASSFLRGETPRDPKHSNWRPTIDFFSDQDHFAKLLEGGYDDRAQTAGRHRDGVAKALEKWDSTLFDGDN